MQIEVELGAKVTVLFGNVEAVTDRESGQPVRDRDTGFPVFRANLIILGSGGRPDTIAVKVSGEPKGLTPGQPVRLPGLVLSTWSFEGKSGVSFRAETIEAFTAPAPASGSKAAAA